MNSPPTPLTLVARFPGLRALAWSGNQLYASRGYELVRASIEDARHFAWQPVAHFRPSLRRRLSATNRLTARLFRDGFHALAILPSGAIIGCVPGSIVTLRPGESEFRQTHTITRALTQIAAISSSSIYGCRVRGRVFFSTMVEPSEVNRDRTVRVYGADLKSSEPWQPLLAWKKDVLPMGLFQYGNAFLPNGENETPLLAVTTIAVESDDMATSLYKLAD